MVQRGKPKPQGYISSGIQVRRSRAQPTAAPRCTERHRAARCPGSCPGSCPALAKLSPYERFGASRPKNRPFLAKSAPSERISPSRPAPPFRRGRFLFAQEGGLLPAPVRNPSSRPYRRTGPPLRARPARRAGASRKPRTAHSGKVSPESTRFSDGKPQSTHSERKSAAEAGDPTGSVGLPSLGGEANA